MQRNTRQREAIRQVLQESGRPLSTREVLEAAKEKVPGLGIATVYRTLNSLLEEKEISAVELPGETPRYEVAGKHHHHHFHCTVCGKVFEIENCPGDLERLAPPGFKAERHEIVLYGHCPECPPARKP
ncbi:MAG: Fur family transcriptional regulator [Deinococcota bacterium]|uniref:Ferric uptake regulator, Fur family n=1 Tax=Allomeiothermus silvanus (strain ATCC 700542 / DSM 9946 / NBRC 106475 / NCIMB 13440 / VI-R2) TaxID=526227 RepID=D7BH21_ALLS1|nr:transcriptional repressor [Allomeiothermus silvanus]ADH63874.1 ferric uptake regulator, Fur family [Allomeiothermus silvanus DSM 9946]MBI5811155.1 transcriptional repressor [Allomeiothermus silvanus]MCL6569336.1 transcriptional repressor [Allomeiothermus silvanus]